MVKSTRKPTTESDAGPWTGFLEGKAWKFLLQVLPWLGLGVLGWQIYLKYGTGEGYGSETWRVLAEPGSWWHRERWWYWWWGGMVLPLVALWLDALKWTLLMDDALEPDRGQGGRMRQIRTAGSRIPILCYSMLGSLAIPGRLGDFAGRCRFYRADLHPRVLASTLMASSTQWVPVWGFPALWLFLTGDKAWIGSLNWPEMLAQWLRHPGLPWLLSGLTLAALGAWFAVARRLRGYGWQGPVLVEVYAWTILRYGLLLGQWVLLLQYLGINLGVWEASGVVSLMLVVQWFLPMGAVMDLGFKGALSWWLLGSAMPVPALALLVPLWIWSVNLLGPSLAGLLWWEFRGKKFRKI